ncbi:HAD family phosphatase [Spirulina subsalsa FACHB-351]|uniref:HAD family phosphatase n=1 Tax=Spirulina subsalsa FACHB-351 TaxID=234711 RepID=A0ABT3L4A1_9CYAN|nr:HAD family phosphatase [Spirulina subsalsa]MCW6036341.1 HAD family phosphatase [Spirulina subsalsa FACHB-351]
MSLKAVLLDFNGTIINDEPVHEELINDLLLQENLRPSPHDFHEICLGRSDRVCLKEILARRGRVVSEEYLDRLIARKSQAYQARIATLDPLPIYPEVEEFLQQLQREELIIGLVTGALRSEVDTVLQRASLAHYFQVFVTGDEVTTSKPDPYGYLLAVERLNRLFPYLNITAQNCLAIEDSPAGITAAKQAKMQVVGIAHTYPFHMLQRQTNWTVDRFSELELERVKAVFAPVPKGG